MLAGNRLHRGETAPHCLHQQRAEHITDSMLAPCTYYHPTACSRDHSLRMWNLRTR